MIMQYGGIGTPSENVHVGGHSRCFDMVQAAVRDYFLIGRRGDIESDGGFRRRVIERRYPVMNAIGPVVADRRRIAVFVVRENQAVFGFAVVVDCRGRMKSPGLAASGRVNV